MYFCKLRGGAYIYLLLYVDDMLVASSSRLAIDELKVQLSNEFEMKDLVEAKRILGIEIGRDKKNGRICSTPVAYLKKVLQRFHVSMDTKPVSVPLGAHLKLSVGLSPKSVEDR